MTAEPDYTFRAYEDDAARTRPKFKAEDNLDLIRSINALGVSGEAGECAEVVKKYLGHGLSFEDARDHLHNELGDVLWYVSTLAMAFDLHLGRIAKDNIAKLRERYPDGFYERESSGA